MKLIVGLGNIGSEYEHTRHNVGFDTVDVLAANLGLTFKEEKAFKGYICQANILGHKAILLKPTTYMNLSGDSILLVMKFYKIDAKDLIVVSDDLDMNPGKVRFRQKGSAGGHNGLKSIIANLHTEEFKRIKIGISRDTYIPIVDWVLGRPNKEDALKLNESFKFVAKCLEDYIVSEDDARLAQEIAR